MPTNTPGPYRKKNFLRRYFPWFLIKLGIFDKEEDCEKRDVTRIGIILMVLTQVAIIVGLSKGANFGSKSNYL